MKFLRSKSIWLVITLFVTPILAGVFLQHTVFAEEETDHIVETTFFGNLQDDGEGCGVNTILSLVVDIMSMGVGILGAIGIMVAGIQYLTAKDNLEQTKKAKRRIGEIVVGLAIYALIYVALNWLLPDGKFRMEQKCASISDEQLAALKDQEKAERDAEIAAERDKVVERRKTVSSTPSGSSGSGKSSSDALSKIDEASTWSEKIALTAEALSWPLGTKKSKYHHEYPLPTGFKKWNDLNQGKPNETFMSEYDRVRKGHGFGSYSAMGADCGVFVTTVLRASGHDKRKGHKMKYGQADGYYGSDSGWKQVDKAQRGDVCIFRFNSGTGFHTKIFLGNGKIAEANYSGQNFGHIAKGSCNGAASIWRAVDEK